MNLRGVNLSAILILGVVNTGIGCYLNFSSISDLPVQSGAVPGYFEPLLTVLFSACILSEKMSYRRCMHHRRRDDR